MTALRKAFYVYSARDLQGKKIKGKMLAANTHEVHQALLEQKYFLLSTHKKDTFLQKALSRSSKIPTQDLMDFCLHMQFMDQAGVPLINAIQDAEEHAKRLSPYLKQLIHDIKFGKTLSQAFKEQEAIFPPLFGHILSLAEQTGKLHEGFKKIYDHLQWTSENKKLITQSLRYPLIVFFLLCISMWFMSVYVIPQIHELMAMSPSALPAASLWLLDAHNFLCMATPKALAILSVLGLLLLGLRILSPRQHLLQDRWFLRIPQLGYLLQTRDISLYLHYFHVCLAAHMDLLEALDQGKKVIKNRWILKRLDLCTEAVRHGETLSSAFRLSKIFSTSCVRLIQVGELTGQLLPLLALLESYAQRDIKNKTSQFTQWLQPILLGIIALMFIWIIMGVFYPIYDQLLLMEE